MKFKIMLIGLALALVLCISPVVAVTGDDFKDVFEVVDGVDTYKYLNLNDPGEKYIELHTEGTRCLNSIVVFKPANIPDAPMMKVDTFKKSSVILLPTPPSAGQLLLFSNSNVYVLLMTYYNS